MFFRIVLLLIAVSTALGQEHRPVIGPFGVLHGASMQPVRLSPDFQSPAGIAPGSIFILKGAYLGPDDLIAGTAPYGLRLPDVPGGTEVHVRSLETGEVRQAWIVHAWSFQVAAILPEDFPVGEAEAQVWHGGHASEPVAFPVVRSFPARFNASEEGSGHGIIQNYVSPAELELNGLTHSAKPGQYVILWGTGLGDAGGDEVQARIDGQAYPVTYAGPAPGIPGVDQINVQLPADIQQPGCYVRIGLEVRGLSGQEVSIAVAEEGGACKHPWGLTAERLAEIEAGDRAIWIKTDLADGTSELEGPRPPLGPQPPFTLGGSVITASAYSLNVAGLESAANTARFNNLIPQSRLACSMGETIGLRIGGGILPGEPIPSPPEPENPPSRPAEAGAPWTFTGPSGQSFDLTRLPPGQAPAGWLGPGQFEPGYLSPGEWVLTTPGGTDVPPIEAAVQMPALPEVSGPSVIRRDEAVVLTWPTNQFANSMASVELAFRLPVPGDPRASRNVGFVCPALLPRGRLEIPMADLQEPLENVESGVLTFRVAWRGAVDSIPGVDRYEASGLAYRTWSVLLE